LAKAYAGKYGEEVSEASVRRALRQAGYSIKKARRVLTLFPHFSGVISLPHHGVVGRVEVLV
jgi:hypothetical protein